MSAVVDERVSDEIEALEAILMDDVVIKRVGDVPDIIETVVHPSTGDDTDQQFVCVTLEVKLTPEYPDTSPDVVLRNPRGLDDALLATIHSQIRNKLNDCLGQPVVFELIELIRENLTERNLPSGQCVICLFGFTAGDVFIKTQCYHHFHSHCLATHLISGLRNYQEEYEILPNWQQMNVSPYQQSCPVCRTIVTCDVESLRKAPPPQESITAAPFCVTDELKVTIADLQHKMSALLAQQRAKGGVVSTGYTGPPPLTITTPADNQNNVVATNGPPAAKPEPAAPRQNGNASNSNSSPGSPNGKSGYRGPYRGFNRRGKPGRRGRGNAR
ncbi:unnamed protein product [Chrysodeixis includens]|uniref:E3 ubiquitin-protein ligase RNF25 n=1 Tax=Chrysodeixis includens TaxID=689277 RepID=A0A9P0BM61_CHRIL|nr:unnamed protein product [Chrysodeixis includens]